MKYFLAALGLLLFALVCVIPGARDVEAHDKGDFLGFCLTPMQKVVRDRGYGTYSLDARASAWRDEIQAHLNDYKSKVGVTWIEVTGTADLLITMPDVFDYGPGVAGVAWPLGLPGDRDQYPAVVEVNYRLPFASFLTTFSHENGHAIDCQEDLYIHPLTCDTQRTWTRMSCGTGVWRITSYDRDIAWNIWLPDLPSYATMSCDASWCWVQYNGIRQSSINCVRFAGAAIGTPSTEKDNVCGHPSNLLDNASAVSFYGRQNGGAWVFLGFNGPAPAANGTSLTGRGLLKSDWCGRGWEFAVRPVSMLPITWHPSHDLGGIPYISGDLKPVGGC